jgi:hypothetical protein
VGEIKYRKEEHTIKEVENRKGDGGKDKGLELVELELVEKGRPSHETAGHQETINFYKDTGKRNSFVPADGLKRKAEQETAGGDKEYDGKGECKRLSEARKTERRQEQAKQRRQETAFSIRKVVFVCIAAIIVGGLIFYLFGYFSTVKQVRSNVASTINKAPVSVRNDKSPTSPSEQTQGGATWDYFLLSEGTIKMFCSDFSGEGTKGLKRKDTYHVVKNQEGEAILKIITELLKDDTIVQTTHSVYKLDKNKNQVLMVEHSGLSGDFKCWELPKIVLSLPLQVGKKWVFPLKHDEDLDKLLKLIGEKAPKVERREVVGIEKIKVPAGEFDAFVIEVTLGESMDVFGKDKSYEYYAKGVGLVKRAEKTKEGKWMGIFELETILKAGEAESKKVDTLFPHVVVRPIDESSNNSSFKKFRDELLVAIEKKDVRFLVKHMDKDISYSFGSDRGIEEFLKGWGLKENPERSEIWEKLKEVLLLGGRFDKNGNFTAPYTFTDFPDSEQIDVYSHCIVIEKDVKIFERPSSDSKVIGNLSYEVVRLNDPNSFFLPSQKESIKWTAVTSSSGIKGFVSRNKLRSPGDYRVSFENRNGQWKMAFFIAGD